MDIFMVGKKATPAPRLSRMYIVNFICGQLVTIHIMLGSVPQRDACFQWLIGDALWNMPKLSGIGRDVQKCAWGDGPIANVRRMQTQPSWAR